MTVPADPQAIVEVIVTKFTQNKNKNSVTAWCSTQWRALLSELIATMLQIFLGCMTCIPIEGSTQLTPMYSCIGFGLVVFYNMQIFGHTSGAHMNPAVTLCSIIWGSTSIARGIAYIIIQCFGAVLGYGILVLVSPIDIAREGICVTLPCSGLNTFKALVIEFLLTATFSFLCCGLWDPVNKHQQESAPLKFGLAVAGLALAGAPLTGASMNPARSLGPAFWSGVWTVHWVYWVGPFVGGAFAVFIYKHIWLKNI